MQSSESQFSVSPTKASSNGERELMYRVKNNSNFCQRIKNMTKANGRLVIVIVLIVVAALYVSMYANPNQNVAYNTKFTNLDADRSETYKVKVIPANMDDDALNALPKESFSYLAMIDAGSSGCRAHVYRYGKLGNVHGRIYILPQHLSKKVKPGLSSFASNPTDAGVSLTGLVDFLKQEVPEQDWSVTPIWLKATAGLRMLDKDQSDAVLVSVKSFLSDKKNSPFLFRPAWARIISGNEEGGFGWIAYNYLRKIIGPKKDASASIAPYAVIEMGGASAQVSQLAPSQEEADKIPSEYRFTFTIEKETYNLYTHSYLGFGAEQGREQLNKLLTNKLSAGDSKGELIKDPCLNTGFVRPGTTPRKEPYEGPQGVYFNISGAANTADGYCSTSLLPIFGATTTTTTATAAAAPSADGATTATTTTAAVDASGASAAAAAAPVCEKNGPHSFGCVYQPKFVAESTNILLFENFYYVSSALGVKPYTATAAEQAAAATAFPLVTTPANILEASNRYCALEYSALDATYPLDSQPKDVNTKMCFIGSYAYAFVTSGLKLPKEKVVTIQKDVGKSEIEWALGAAYKEVADFLLKNNLRSNN